MSQSIASPSNPPVPRGDISGFAKHMGKDLLAGFLVFLIALPLCLAISIASGVPPIAGVFTAVIGALVTPLLSNSELTIKGPAAGLIVVVMGCVTEFGEITGDYSIGGPAYQMMLAVGLTSGIIQIGFGLFRLGILGEFFPSSVVHGMLAAIGIIIISKQIHTALGVMQVTDSEGQRISEPLELVARVPQSLMEMNPEIAIIGLISLVTLFGLPWIRNKYVKRIPAQLIVVIMAIPLGMYFDLSHEHTYSMMGHEFELSEKFLVKVPESLMNAIALPDFSALQHPAAWKWVLMFALIGSLESLLSARAIDLLDPWKRKSDLNRDLLAVGVANTLAAGIGGVPMISEIVRSKANIDDGARTRFSNFWHGLFLLTFVALLPGLIHRIPLAALAAMLVYTGFRLASPREFVHVYYIGREQFIIFVATVLGVLATDLLVGVSIGVGVKFVIHFINGVPMKSFFKPFLEIEEQGENTCIIRAKESAVFSNWIPFKRQIEDVGLVHHRNLIIDLSGTTLVDHSVMEKLHDMQAQFQQEGLVLKITGLETHQQLSPHQHSSRRRGIVVEPAVSSPVEKGV